MKASNLTRGRLLGDSIMEGKSFFARIKGLMGTPGLSKGEGLWLPRCGRIHSYGMRYEFDAVFIDGGSRVVGLYSCFGRNRTSRMHRDVLGVLALPAGTVERTGTRLKDVIRLARIPGIDL